MTAQERIQTIERMIKAMRRDGMNAAEAAGDFETGDAIHHTAKAALELLSGLRAELEPKEIPQLIAA